MLFSKIWILVSRGFIGPLFFFFFLNVCGFPGSCVGHDKTWVCPHQPSWETLHDQQMALICRKKIRSNIVFCHKENSSRRGSHQSSLGRLPKLGFCSTSLGGTPQQNFGTKTIKQRGWRVKLILRFSLLRVKTACKALVAKLVTLIEPTRASDDCLSPWLYIKSQTVSAEVGRRGAPILMIY